MKIKIYGLIEWYNLQKSTIGDETLLRYNTKNLQCFCDGLRDDIGMEKAMKKKFEVHANGEAVVGEVCRGYLNSYYLIKYLKFAVPLMIEGINLLVKLATKGLVHWIKYDNASVTVAKIVTIEYLLVYFNTGIIILVSNANLNAIEFENDYLDGRYSDFNYQWFMHMAPLLINPFFINFINPFIKPIVDFLL